MTQPQSHAISLTCSKDHLSTNRTCNPTSGLFCLVAVCKTQVFWVFCFKQDTAPSDRVLVDSARTAERCLGGACGWAEEPGWEDAQIESHAARSHSAGVKYLDTMPSMTQSVARTSISAWLPYRDIFLVCVYLLGEKEYAVCAWGAQRITKY